MQTILLWLMRALGAVKIYIAVALVGLAVGFSGAWKARDLMAAGASAKALKVEAGQLRAALRVTAAQQQIASDIGRQAAEERVRIEYRTRTLIREVPTYVTPEIDARFDLAVGLVRLHDAAALGVDVSAVPDPAGRADDQAADVAASDFGAAVVENYGVCHALRSQVLAWQSWAARAGAVTP